MPFRIELPLVPPSAQFEARVQLGGAGAWRLRLIWRERPSASLPADPAQMPERAGRWYADLLSDAGDVLVAGSRLAPGSPLFWPMRAAGTPPGTFWVQHVGADASSIARSDLGGKLRIWYYPDEEAT